MPERIGTEGLGGSCEEEERERLEKQACGTDPVEGWGGSPKNNGKNCKQVGLGQVCTVKSLCRMSWQQESQLEDYSYGPGKRLYHLH